MKKVLEISEKTARRLYKDSSNEFKTTLEETFGKDFFSGKVTDRVKTYEDACVETGEIPINEADLLKAGFTSDEIVYRKIKTITKALNEGWIADWKDGVQQKWIPWFMLSSAGFVFSATRYRCSYASAGYGSRLCFKSNELATYAGKQFTDLYKSFII